jgi:predicted HicB family RNase H-like nuclease
VRAYCPGLQAQGATADEAVANLDEARHDWLEYRLKNGLAVPEPPSEDFSGKFLLRMSPALHATLAAASKRQGLSLNQLINNILAEYVGGSRMAHDIVSVLKELLSQSEDMGTGEAPPRVLRRRAG